MAIQPIALDQLIWICGYYEASNSRCRSTRNDQRQCRPELCPIAWTLSAELSTDHSLMTAAGLDPELLEDEIWMMPLPRSQAAYRLMVANPEWAIIDE